MPIEFACSSCSKPLRVADEVAGKLAKCPHCDAQMQVPSVNQTSDAVGTNAGQNPFAGPSSASRTALETSGTITLRRVDVASAAKTMGVLYGLVGLLSGVLAAVVVAVGAMADGGQNGVQAIGAFFLVLLALPVLNGIGGLLGGALIAVMYNLVAKFVGGLKFET